MMKRSLLVFLFLITINCKTTKKESKKPVQTYVELITVLKTTSKIDDAKALAEKNGLLWGGLVINHKDLKAVTIKVPSEKKDFWIEHLQASSLFSSIQKKENDTIELLKKELQDIFIKVVKGPCSGDCPVYEVDFYKDGKVLFNGIKYTLFKGEKDFTLTALELENVNLFFEKTAFPEYKSSYIDKATLDGFPNTNITYQNKEVKIKLWKLVPIELAYAHEYLEGILLERNLIE